MRGYILAFLLLFSAPVFATSGGIYTIDANALPNYPTDAKCASGDADVKIIEDDADWDDINSATFTFFCVKPGDYNLDIQLTRSGTALDPRYIRYYNPAETYEPHPVHMAEADRAKIQQLRPEISPITEHWVFDRITVDGTGDSAVWAIVGNNHMFHNRGLYENSGGNGNISGGGDFNTVQNSVLRNGKIPLDSGDDNCLSVWGERMNVIGNELYNCTGDTLIMPNFNRGGLLADNESYVTPAYYTDCAGSIDPDGACMCVENGMDFKGGADILDDFPFPVEEQLLVVQNKVWGFNRNDDGACVTGAGPQGIAIVTHAGPVGQEEFAGEGVRFESNVITSGPNRIEAIAFNVTNDINRHYTYINNLVYDVDYAHGLHSGKTENNEMYYNTYLDAAKTYFFHVTGENNEHKCNVYINAEENAITGFLPGEVFATNAFYNFNDDGMEGINDLVLTRDSESKNEMYCWAKNHITDIKAECVALASTTPESPHADMCNAPAEALTKGNNDILQLTRVQAGFIAPYLQETFEAEDSDPTLLEYKFVAPVKGVYQFWFRATAADTDSNALSYSVIRNGRSLTNQIVRFAYPAITSWSKGAVNLNLEAGLHTLKVVKREAGIVLDKFLVTNNPVFVSP